MEDAFMNGYFCDGREECIGGINHRIRVVHQNDSDKRIVAENALFSYTPHSDKV